MNEGYDYFREMNQSIAVDCVYNFLNVRIQPKAEPAPEQPASENAPAEDKPAIEATIDEKPVTGIAPEEAKPATEETVKPEENQENKDKE